MSDEVNQIPVLQSYRSVVVTNAKKEKFDITSAVGELNIFEDMFSNTLSGNILYMDDHGGLSTIDFKSNEKLTIELYKSSGESETTAHEFFVYSVDNLNRIKDGSSAFVIHFVSFESIINSNTRCYSAMNGSNSQVVNDLYKYLSSTKKLEVEETVGSYKFVMPSITPFECINWYAGRSISSESNGSYYLFYETLKDGFKYKCVDTLVEKEPIATYRYEPAGNTFLIKDVTNIRDYEVIQVTNSLEGVSELYTTQWVSDSIRKKITKNVYDFVKDKKSTLNRGDSLTSLSDNGFDYDLSERRDIYGSNVLVRDENRNTHSQTSTYYYDAIQPKLGAIRQYSGLKLRIFVFGNNDLQIGKTININFMKTQMFDEESKANSFDETLSGKYLITAIRYIYKANNLEMAVEVVKDTKK